jgi:hypothetical protein
LFAHSAFDPMHKLPQGSVPSIVQVGDGVHYGLRHHDDMTIAHRPFGQERNVCFITLDLVHVTFASDHILQG